MPRQTSKGTCTFCHGEFAKAGMTKHLETCEQRAIAEAKTGSRQKIQKTEKIHLVVEGRDTWLECCGHLSAFEIGGVRYSVDAGMDDEWGMDEKSMRVRLDKVFSPGQTSSYEYDYGTTTELKLKVISEREVEAKGKAIQILARNSPPLIQCEVCGKPATSVCAQCIYDDKGWVCDSCAADHECDEDMLLPVVNSPRVGMCAYAG